MGRTGLCQNLNKTGAQVFFVAPPPEFLPSHINISHSSFVICYCKSLQVTDQQGEFLQILQEELRANHQDVNQMEAVLHRGQLGASINTSTGLGGTQIS